VQDSTGKYIFIGYDKLVWCLNMKTIRAHPDYNPSEQYILKLWETVNSHSEGFVIINEYIQTLNGGVIPPFNARRKLSRYRVRVKCNETGVVYPTSTEACRALGINSSRMSNHLMRRPGFRTIYGLTFDYYKPGEIDDEEV
jgi:hypothetical protein